MHSLLKTNENDLHRFRSFLVIATTRRDVDAQAILQRRRMLQCLGRVNPDMQYHIVWILLLLLENIPAYVLSEISPHSFDSVISISFLSSFFLSFFLLSFFFFLFFLSFFLSFFFFLSFLSSFFLLLSFFLLFLSFFFLSLFILSFFFFLYLLVL